MRRKLTRFLVQAGFATLTAASAVSAQPIAVDPVNPQYFRFQNQTIPLIGYSAEYICPIKNTNTKICALDTYIAFLNTLASPPGINKIRLWVGLNHSPARSKGAAKPFPNEQPFKWLECLPSDPTSIACQDPTKNLKWDLDTWDTAYFTNLRAVVAHAASKSPAIIVEVTMFDPWSGEFSTSPWNATNNIQNKGFTEEKYFASYSKGTMDTPDNQLARAKQILLLQKVADELNSFDNVYYEVANEPDIDPVSNGATSAQVSTWHGAMAQALYDHEQTKAKRHLIGVNFYTDAAFSTVRNTSHGNSRASVVSGHYTHAWSLDTDNNGSLDLPRYGAIGMIQRYHNGDSNELNRIFGFNETKAISGVSNPSSRDGARAEAWEFMLNEGGMLDHYSLDYTTSGAADVRSDLKALSSFLATFNLRNVQRVKPGTTAAPNWAGLQSQNFCSPTTCFNWASFAWPGQQYGLYYHRGLPSNTQYGHYTAPAPGSVALTLNLSNLGTGCTALAPCIYRYEWIEPRTAALKCTTVPCTGTLSWPGTGTVSLPSPTYSFDIALRLTRQ